MGRAVALTGPRRVTLLDEVEPPLAPRELRVETLYSGISAGTELTEYRGSNPHLNKAWDAKRRLFAAGAPARGYPMTSWGYEEVGRVTEVGPDVGSVRAGDLVWGAWGHRSSAVVTEARAAACLLPDGLPPLTAVFARMGAIALNAVHDAQIHVGEVVAVFGQGVAGLLATQLATLNGGTVVAVDGIPRRLALARSLGAAHVVDLGGEEPAVAIKELTAGVGADVAIDFSGSYAALNEAIRATAYNSRVVGAGFYQGDGEGLCLGEEFHHNRIEVVSSQISSVSPTLDHRWDRSRLERTVIGLAAAGRLNLEGLISHVYPVEDAAEAYRLLDETPAEAVQVVLDFGRPS